MSNPWDEDWDPFDPATPQGDSDPEWQDDLWLTVSVDDAASVVDYPLPTNITRALHAQCGGQHARIVQLLTAARPYLPDDLQTPSQFDWEGQTVVIIVHPCWEEIVLWTPEELARCGTH